MKPSRSFWPLVVLTLATTAANADPASHWDINLSSASEAAHNVPNQHVIDILKREFESDTTRMPLSGGDLRVDGRWNCREFFTEASGSTHQRSKSYSFKTYVNGIIEEVLNFDVRFYVFTKDEFRGDSNSKQGLYNEVRVDRDGNLRMALKDSKSGKVKSYSVCLKKYYSTL